jgi:hypothetical protein
LERQCESNPEVPTTNQPPAAMQGLNALDVAVLDNTTAMVAATKANVRPAGCR